MERLSKEPQDQPALIRQCYDAFIEVLNSHRSGEFGDYDEFACFSLTRKNHYYFSHQEVSIGLIQDPLEHYVHIDDPNFTKTGEGERWIEIHISPKKLDHPQIARHSEKGKTHFYADALEIFISSKGRAFQLTSWSETNPPKQEDDSPQIAVFKNHPEEVTFFDVDHNPMMGIEIIKRLPPLQPADLDWLNLLLEEIQIEARTGARIPLIEWGVVESDSDSFPDNTQFSKN